MFNLIRKNKYFLCPYFGIILIISIILLSYSKSEIHLFINKFHNSFFDLFFKYYTHLGDGIVVAVFIFILLFIKYRYAIITAISGILAIIVVQSLKRYIIPDVNRPELFFKGIHELYFVPDVITHTSHSFPSGHTTTGFLIFFISALITNNKFLKFLFLIFAILIGYSRVYLSQHFLNDVYFASIFSIIIGFFTFFWVSNWKNNKLDNSILNLFNSKI
ncbi:MAG: phosphatase PAP2 family protein [Bacteroidales bacterium]|nr:phosphatase PAP2 family protein [Bacteroidales bacterium]MBN2756952.1 phosphatase PAP2 family protein [Bacteroidales bacterium]